MGQHTHEDEGCTCDVYNDLLRRRSLLWSLVYTSYPVYYARGYSLHVCTCTVHAHVGEAEREGRLPADDSAGARQSLRSDVLRRLVSQAAPRHSHLHQPRHPRVSYRSSRYHNKKLPCVRVAICCQ